MVTQTVTVTLDNPGGDSQVKIKGSDLDDTSGNPVDKNEQQIVTILDGGDLEKTMVILPRSCSRSSAKQLRMMMNFIWISAGSMMTSTLQSKARTPVIAGSSTVSTVTWLSGISGPSPIPGPMG